MSGPWEQFRPKPGPWEAFGAGPAKPTEGGGFDVSIVPPQRDTAPETQTGTIQVLKALGAVAGGMLAPQLGPLAGAARFLRPALNLGARMLGAGTGSTAGGVTGEAIQGNLPAFGEMAEDFKQGAEGEAFGTVVALPFKALAKGGSLVFNAVKSRMGQTGKVAGALAEDAGVALGKKHFNRLTEVVGGNDAGIPAPNTLKVLTEELTDPASGGWNPLAKKLFGPESGAPMGARGAAEQAVSGAPPKIGATTAWTVTPKADVPAGYATVKSPGPGWEPFYVVHSDGGAELFFRDPKMGLYRPTGTSGKVAAKEMLTEDQLLKYVTAQRAGVPAVGVVPATGAVGDRFVPRGKLFDVARRDDAIPWRELNDFSAKFRNRDFSNLSKEEIDTFLRLRDAIEADVKAHSPAAAKAWDKAWAAYRFGRDPVGVAGKAVASHVVKPAATAATFLLQPSHGEK